MSGETGTESTDRVTTGGGGNGTELLSDIATLTVGEADVGM